MTETRPVICRICANVCSMVAETDGNHVLKLTGDKDSPLHRGYSCLKGRSQYLMLQHPERLLHPLKRTADGRHVPIALDDAIAEIAARLRAIVEEHGPSAVALYQGTGAVGTNTFTVPMATAFMSALGSPMSFDPGTIDQPGKLIAKGFHGIWMGGGQAAHDPDVAMFIGCNPLISHQTISGNPGDLFKEIKSRGGSVIVIDPRRTETAKHATLHLQPRPGEDVPILAGIIRVILAEGLYDAAFVADNVAGVEDLRRAVEPFTPQYVADRADIDADDLVAAARTFATAGRGFAAAGTGPNMSGHGILLEYLILSLDSLCGHLLREGDRVRNALSVVPMSNQMADAQALPPFPSYNVGQKMRIRGLAQSIAGLPTATLAEEILLEGEGQIRALINLSGNPVNAWPDQLRTIEALESIELLVGVDTRLWSTARFADYIIPPMLPLEMPGSTILADYLSIYANAMGYPESFAQYVDAVVEPPEGSEVIEEWAFFYRVAQHMGLQLELYPGFGGAYTSGGTPTAIDMTTQPTNDELFDIVLAGTRVPLEEIRRHPHGAFFPDPAVYVGPKAPGWEGRLDVGNREMMADLVELAAAPPSREDGFPLRLISRRSPNSMNSPTPGDGPHRRRYNPAFMNPADLAELDVQPGDLVEIRSPRAAIVGIAEADDTVKRGVVSMSHCFGDIPEFDHDLMNIGSNTNRLIWTDDRYDRYSGQPRMSAVPVAVRACPELSVVGVPDAH